MMVEGKKNYQLSLLDQPREWSNGPSRLNDIPALLVRLLAQLLD